ncbi:hypothetical protein BCR42DRAFT_72445 [Absidia repens]|uniref:Uncharacterized protein n=1 Tax=Absidia repens TaxID=90262 RepID=A0A1X2IB76_9FUNG|nr:hypothetical protein BCR42DRAFT_72445 [Absidia repens]
MSGNKRFTRSGKKSGSDDNAGNFVFSFPGTASPNQSFTFGGSAPSSPIGSPAGFGSAQPPTSPSIPTFGGGAPSSPSASSNVFVFGAGSSSSSLPGSPNLGANNIASSSPASSLRRTFTDITPTPSNTSEGTGLRRSNSDLGTPSSAFTFGSSANSSSTTSSSFTFGGGQSQTIGSNPAPTSNATTSKLTGTMAGQTAPTGPSSFSFGSPANAAPSSPSSFSFGGTPASVAPSTSSPAPATFSFGSPASTTKTGTPSISSTGTPKFSFGSTAPPAAASGTASSQFSVGGSPTVSFGTPAQKAETGATPGLSLKMPVPSTTTTSTPAGSPFGGSSSATSTATSAPTLSFSIPSTGPSKPSATLEKKDDAAKQSDKQAPSTSIFSFGLPGGNSTTKSATSSATSTTATPSISGLPSFSAAKPTTDTTTSAVSAATPRGPNAFSFSTTLENLEKTAKQPSQQIGAALITPSLNALRQNQIVTHTNFRIDNILPSTRYTELPEQARKELDELAQYIHGESQRCDYIKKHAAPKRQDTMKEAKHEYEILSYKLDSLSNSLQIQVNAVEELFDLLKEQIRHFKDGQSVIDACQHPGGRSARWLFGYGNDDDYFMTLSTRLAIRMEEYNHCVREIEFTANSWTKNRAQSPQGKKKKRKKKNIGIIQCNC